MTPAPTTPPADAARERLLKLASDVVSRTGHHAFAYSRKDAEAIVLQVLIAADAILSSAPPGAEENNLDRELRAALIARLANWATEIRRSAKELHAAGLQDAGDGNTALARDLDAAVTVLCAPTNPTPTGEG